VDVLLIKPLLPPIPTEFLTPLPTGGVLRLFYRERIGLSTLLEGPFEEAEVRALCAQVSPGSCVIDVGANVGVFTVPLARAASRSGLVIAVEPMLENVERLKANLALNDLDNVAIEPSAAGKTDGTTRLVVAGDPAYASTERRLSRDSGEGSIAVRERRLDNLWSERGHPHVTAVKIDVEGAELDVLRGGATLIEQCRPPILLEATSADQLSTLADFLTGYSYVDTQPSGFRPWNHLFVQAANRAADTQGRSQR
jgi:FkbM family methyltransferase